MSDQDKIDQYRREARSRGAVEILDGEGSGFVEEPLAQELPEDLATEIAEIEARQHDAKPIQQHIEAAAELRSSNLEAVRDFRWLEQEELATYRPGRILHRNTFLELVRRIRPDAFYNDYSQLGLRGLNVLEDNQPTFVLSVQDGQMLEWSQMRLDDHHIPTNEIYRGWRTVLLELIIKGLASEDQVRKVFGDPSGPRAPRWHRHMFMLRNKRCPTCEKQLCECKGRFDGLRADNYAYQKVG